MATETLYILYQWNLEGIAIQGATNYAYKPTPKGSYTVSVHNGGCDRISQPKNIEDVSVNDLNSPYIKIFPNPVKSYLYITAPPRTNATIFSIDGKAILSQEISDDAININMLDNGFYIVKITDEKGRLLALHKLTKSE